MTGIELIDKNGNVQHGQSVNFYRKCIENKLGMEEFQFKADGTTYLKLMALSSLMDITKVTKIIGDYNNIRPFLFVDKVIGGVNFCLGLSKENDNYVPSSALLEDIKKLTYSPSQVITILQKEINSDIYTDVKHVTKGLDLHRIILPDEITKLISLENYVYKAK